MVGHHGTVNVTIVPVGTSCQAGGYYNMQSPALGETIGIFPAPNPPAACIVPFGPMKPSEQGKTFVYTTNKIGDVFNIKNHHLVTDNQEQWRSAVLLWLIPGLPGSLVHGLGDLMPDMSISYTDSCILGVALFTCGV